jgi:hypothetical protein
MLTKEQLIKILILDVAKMLGAVALAFFAAQFLGTQIMKIGDSLAEKRRLAFVLEHRNETLAKLKNDFESIGDGASALNAVLPPVDNIIVFMDAVENLSNKTGLQQSPTFGDPNPTGSGLYLINFSVSLKAGLVGLQKYLAEFEALPYLAQIDSVSISGAGARGIIDDSSIALPAKFYARNP